MERDTPLIVAPDPMYASAELHAWFWLQQPEPVESAQKKERRNGNLHVSNKFHHPGGYV